MSTLPVSSIQVYSECWKPSVALGAQCNLNDIGMCVCLCGYFSLYFPRHWHGWQLESDELIKRWCSVKPSYIVYRLLSIECNPTVNTTFVVCIFAHKFFSTVSTKSPYFMSIPLSIGVLLPYSRSLFRLVSTFIDFPIGFICYHNMRSVQAISLHRGRRECSKKWNDFRLQSFVGFIHFSDLMTTWKIAGNV